MIEVRNISAGYNDKNVLSGISLSLPKGKLISLIGQNGSGKSTLLKTILGIMTAKNGQIIFDGKASSELSRRDIARKAAYLAQGKSVADMTVEQMVLHGRFPYLSYPRRYSEKDREIAYGALTRMGIAGMADRPLCSLSGGIRQKAYIALALAQDTDYILLDEPTTYLDIANQVELMNILRDLADGGKGVVTVMHDLPLAFGFSDGIAVIKDGKIAVCDTPDNVCRSGIVRDVFNIDLQYSADENSYSYRYILPARNTQDTCNNIRR
ncbi:MAG: ABC transporter ATP-binding protein [Eubacteriales bacterium]|nr:ABC transporter ATP-binding protein [Eubacteriales bacterium]